LAEDSTRIPKVVMHGRSAEMRSLPLSPVDGFVLSRIDGRLSEQELSTLTGLPADQVQASLEKLVSLRVVEFAGAPIAPAMTGAPIAPATTGAPVQARPTPSRQPPPEPVRPSPPPAPPPRISSSRPPPGSDRPSAGPTAKSPKPPPVVDIPDDTPELREEGVDLDVPLRKRILGLAAALPMLDYYALLGIERTSDKKTIKRAYFELASTFHPDKYFRKELGSFKLKMETIFGRVTQAYDTLSSKEGRPEYDGYLKDFDRTRGIDNMLRDALEEMKRAEADVLAGADRISAPPPLVDGSALGPGSRPSGMPTPAQPISDKARRDALARRLTGGRAPAPKPTSNPPPRSTTAGQSVSPKPGEAVDALRRRYENRLSLARKQQADKYSQMADEAMANNDIVAAANAYKVALTFAEGDAELTARAEAAAAKADELLSETYQRQAAYEEREQNWVAAASSWTKVAKGRPTDAKANERAAHAELMAGGDLHKAADLAQRAISLEPANADYRVTLVNIYLSAGMVANAKRTLEAAAQIAPKSPAILSLQKRLAKAG
jgi:curved DNA-binding protein CbpA